MFNTPVALFVFNRPHVTAKNFQVLRALKPSRLFIIADGPRSGNFADENLCREVRDIVEVIDWPCETSRLYANQNLGGRISIPNGLNWVFSLVEECIILEDDCVPGLSFFQYCAELLNHYRDDGRIMTIGGFRYDGPDEFNGDSFFFSKYPATWGWATWRRTWEKYDLDMAKWAQLRETDWLKKLLGNNDYVTYWCRIFDLMCDNMDAWDYALTFSCWLNDGLSIRSKVNLISNLGFGDGATHTLYENDIISSRQIRTMSFPLNFPKTVTVDQVNEDRIEWVTYSGVDKRIISKGREMILKRKAGNL
jgi:hypothetical protein